jgi:hypothetical protein
MLIAARAALLGLPLVRAADAIADAAGPDLAEALMAWAELLVERLDGRNAAALAGGLRRLAAVETRQDIADLVVFHDPLSPY